MKKYVPSGYQIVNLGELNLTNNQAVIITAEKSETAKLLCDLVAENKLTRKPILLQVDSYSGFATVKANEYISLTLWDDDFSYLNEICIDVQTTQITVVLEEISIGTH